MTHTGSVKIILGQQEQLSRLHERLQEIKVANAEVFSVVKDLQSYQYQFQ